MDEHFANGERLLRALPWLNLTLHFCFPQLPFKFILAARFWPETGVKNAVFVDYFS
jgi:hypothetical protein